MHDIGRDTGDLGDIALQVPGGCYDAAVLAGGQHDGGRFDALDQFYNRGGLREGRAER